MVLTPHFIVGAAIALHFKPLPLALLLAFLSHAILDAIPHWDYSTETIRGKRWRETYGTFLNIGLDFIFGLVIVLLFAEKSVSALAGGFAAVFPDVLTLLPIIFSQVKIFRAYDQFHGRFLHWFRYKKIPLFWKIFSQLFIIVFSLTFLV